MSIIAACSLAFAEANDPAWDRYISSQKQVQVKTHHYMKLEAPKLTELFDKSLDLQLSLIDQKSVRFNFLLAHHPEEIERRQGFESFVNFPWTDEDEQVLEQANGEYRSLKEKIAKLTQTVESDPDFPQLKSQLLSLESNVKYREVISRFRFVPQEIESMLSNENESEERITL